MTYSLIFWNIFPCGPFEFLLQQGMIFRPDDCEFIHLWVEFITKINFSIKNKNKNIGSPAEAGIY